MPRHCIFAANGHIHNSSKAQKCNPMTILPSHCQSGRNAAQWQQWPQMPQCRPTGNNGNQPNWQIGKWQDGRQQTADKQQYGKQQNGETADNERQQNGKQKNDGGKQADNESQSADLFCFLLVADDCCMLIW
jgi:hypothetical protein